MRRSLSYLVGGTVLFWFLTVVPARILWGDSAVLFSGVAALLCLLPSALTLFWSHQSFRGLPEQQLLAVLGGMGVRMVFVTAVGMALFFLHPAFYHMRFWLWVIAFYLVTLTLEMGLLVYGPVAVDQPRNRSR